MNRLLNTKNFYLIVALLSIFTLISAVYIEYVLGAKPCKLCLYQRIPYVVAIFICFFGYSNLKNILWIYFLSLTFLVSLFLSGYHAGIENNINITNKEDLLKSLSENIPNCKDVMFKIFGLSLATINMFISALIVIISLVIIRHEKNR